LLTRRGPPLFPLSSRGAGPLGLNPPFRPGLAGLTALGLGTGFTLGAPASREGPAGDNDGPLGFTVIGRGVRVGLEGAAAGV
jgi:hypothetical protein